MKVLVTGATGFVGRALVSRLVSDGHAVSTWQLSNWRIGRSAIEIDATRDLGSEGLAPQSLLGIDAVVHLAARVHRQHNSSESALAEYRYDNTEKTLCLADAAMSAKIPRFVYVSSAKVHGEVSTVTAYDETHTPLPPDPYSLSKWEAEKGLLARASSDFEPVILRPPLVYGPEVRANFLRVLEAVWRGTPLPLGKAQAPRSMVYLPNLIDAISLCIVNPKAAGRTYLVSDGEDLSASQIIRTLALGMEKPVRLLNVPPGLIRAILSLAGRRADYDRLFSRFQISSQRIRQDLAWAPPFSVSEGLHATARWFRDLHPSRR